MNQKSYIAMTSITYAMKGKEYLRSKGIGCEIERTPGHLGSGCGYSLVLTSDPAAAAELLRSARIPYKSVYPAGGTT
ncbi:MAG: DUF3343 domain-containing protein [Ruminococcus sp.]|nr:DUF3343 domain-containing protein [Ruminococcus sp.]